MAKKKTLTSVPVPVSIESVKHKATRKNIPTEELRDFVREEEQRPQNVLYPRDPSLDPQLVWKGKDEQDANPLEVPAVPVYIQEKIHPHAIIEDFRRTADRRTDNDDQQLGLYGDFNGLPAEFDKRVDFYHHDGHWSNRMILGDSLLVMTSLAEKEGLKGKVQTIYFDPPYGIKFGSNWQVSTRKRQLTDGRAEDATRQPEQVKAFRDTWKLGIHSYLAYMRDRLVLARDLLTESGSIFVQIGEENSHLVRCLLDEVFGKDNLCGQIAFVKTAGLVANRLPDRFDILLWYARDVGHVKYRQLFWSKAPEDDAQSNYRWVDLPDGSKRGMTSREQAGLDRLPEGCRVYSPTTLTSQGNPLLGPLNESSDSPFAHALRPFTTIVMSVSL
jgi:adenine-specific DNA-methyltransferase